MPLTVREVEHVAELAHIALQPGEKESLSRQLGSVVDHVARLQQVDTADVELVAESSSATNVWREDEVVPSLPRTEVLANAPRSYDGLFRVQAVLD